MTVLSAALTFRIPWAESLKDKRSVARRLIDKTRARFNAAIAEVDAQERHKTLVLGVAVLSGEAGHAREQLDAIVRFMEANTDAELTGVDMS